MLDTPPHPLLAPILAEFHARTPIRTWSLIVTVYGDCVLPRGGELWLGTLSAIMSGAGIDEGSVRAAVSRLAREGWLERHRVGRNSHYRLSPTGADAFQDAARKIYGGAGDRHTRGADPAVRLKVVVLPPGADQAGARRALLDAGHGEVAPKTFLAPFGEPSAPPIDAIPLAAEADPSSARRLAALAWPLGLLAARYRDFLALFAPLRDAIGAPDAAGLLDDRDALVLRILLVHAYRRIVLKDPMLPPDISPADWPGTAARTLFREIYIALSPVAERWLDTHGEKRDGGLPAPDRAPAERFAPMPS